MNTKEAIEFLESQKKDSGFLESIEKFNEQIDVVIKRLQMWREFKRECGYYLVGTEGKGNWRIENFMENLEKKYFPIKEEGINVSSK